MKNSNAVGLVMITGFALALQGCASGALEKKVDNEVAQENVVSTSAELQNEASQLIATAPGLSDEQRKELTALQKTTREKINDIRTQSVKLRAVLIKSLITTNYDPEEVNLIKARLKDNENHRLTVTFNAVEKVNDILGHQFAESGGMIMNEFLNGDGHGRRD